MDYFRLAKVLKPQGIRGELKLQAYVDDPNRFFELSHVYYKENGRYVKKSVEKVRLYKSFVYIKIFGCDDRNAAEFFRGVFFYIDRANAAKLPENSYYIADLIGLAVIDTLGRPLGVLQEVLQTGSTDIYRVAGEKEILFPVAPGVLAEVDLEKKQILVDAKRLKEVGIDA